MHTFTAIRGILKLLVAKQNKKVGKNRYFEEKFGKVGSLDSLIKHNLTRSFCQHYQSCAFV